MKIYDFNGKKNICGNQIRLARVRRRMSQSDLAAKMQVEGVILERDSISRIEIGTRFVTDYELLTFAKVLNTDIDWLLTDGDDADA
ncbi:MULTISPECIES: helix-turn-helix transcriptional regulator [Congzhengia]|jgi:transcriptional regulator with XRE-family HTH domain|uniref:Helix-turn-helix transcriptional regulator n=1 Tax=Congzhengia minquanensis TaxID=2763657 RepID=A0A926DMA8_9FIRM|nr:helix-turn-helix transcriptional regulator [Congzhengia minquanensis]MBC8541600.1 helix-turn-helix transcriptional regulator [Congzhengia minquanensis]MBD8948174.1 XRE family transcriptional regulator [Clostridiales bacterium]HBL81877.1 XRE family transcriptional regulator [Clostridiales bacterium]